MNNSDMPAMPIPYQIVDANHEHFKVGSKGLTKREAFAMAALQGLVTLKGSDCADSDITAKQCVRYSNALLKALEE